VSIAGKARELTLGNYVRRRNGVALGAPGSMGNMLARSFGAATFAGFWRYWNPIFGYYLLRGVYRPASRVVPRWAAVIATFIVCGLIHDAATIAARGETRFLFAAIFSAFAVTLIATEGLGIGVAGRPGGVRIAANIAWLIASVAAGYAMVTLIPGWPGVTR
jgi:hypothetical protein